MSFNDIWGLIKESFSEWSEDRASRLAAALAYYTAFSLAPLLVVIIAIAGFVFDEEAARGEVVAQIDNLVGREGAEAIQTMIENVGQSESTGIIATAIGIVTLLVGASGAFGALQDALNTIWEVEPKPGRGIMGIIKDRFLSFTLVLGTGFLLLVSLVVSAGLTALGTYLSGLVPGYEVLWQIINLVISFVVITLMFAALYKFLPDVKMAWSDVWIGAAVTTVLFLIGKLLIGLYLGQSSVASGFGAAGSFVVLLVWIYYSAQIFLMGAEFTQVYANRFGTRIVPDEDAVRVTEEERVQQGMARPEQVEAAAQGRPVPDTTPAAPGQSRQPAPLAVPAQLTISRAQRPRHPAYRVLTAGVFLVGLVMAAVRGNVRADRARNRPVS